MPYDPQRSHRRPRLADDGPAPIDALLDHAEAEVEAAVEAEPAVPAPSVADDAPTHAPVVVDEVELELSSASRRGGPRVAVLAVALLVALLVLAWARRRR